MIQKKKWTRGAQQRKTTEKPRKLCQMQSASCRQTTLMVSQATK